MEVSRNNTFSKQCKFSWTLCFKMFHLGSEVVIAINSDPPSILPIIGVSQCVCMLCSHKTITRQTSV